MLAAVCVVLAGCGPVQVSGAGSGSGDQGPAATRSASARPSPSAPPAALVSVQPAPGGTLGGTQAIDLVFERPPNPAVQPAVTPGVLGTWTMPTPTTWRFEPVGGYPPSSSVTVTMPVGTAGTMATFSTPAGTVLRAQQILAKLGYLPLAPGPDSPAPTDSAAERAAAYATTGSLAWRYPNTPPTLTALWNPGTMDTLTTGAIMAYHAAGGPGRGLDATTFAALMADDLAGKASPRPYTYVIANLAQPQTLSVWQNGQVVFSHAVNSGIYPRPTDIGTWPISARIASDEMKGVNPDGSTYDDKNIPWTQYFHDGEAIHAFNRPSYGSPQSLGCLELPLDAALRVWNLTGYGTLVTTTGNPWPNLPPAHKVAPPSPKPSPKPAPSPSTPPAAPAPASPTPTH